MNTMYRLTSRRDRRRRRRIRIWHGIVLVIGYIAIAYELLRLIVYLYLQWTGASWTIG